MATSHKGTSRLDRLFILLENGTTSTTRKAAAKQLGEVQKKHPHELNNLLGRLMTYIQHKEWDTRIAGAEAIKSVVAEVPLWKPEPSLKKDPALKEVPRVQNRLEFSQINIEQIMNGAQLLLSSSGEEFESVEEEGIDARERVLRARRRIEKKMGLTVGNGTSLGVSSSDLFIDEDLVAPVESSTKIKQSANKRNIQKKPCGDVMAQLTEGMSNREKNRAKRKAKIMMKQNSRDGTQENDSQPPKKRKKKVEVQENEEENSYVKQAPNHEPSPDLWEEWPFEWICEELLNLLFSSTWEWRHGACLALRDILSIHGSGAGIVRGDSQSEMEDHNNSWLEDAAIRMLCVMVLDRFGDFVSDQVVAPVRESCAQALGVLTRSLNIKTVSEILNVLLYLTKTREWEVRHAGFLGIKYMFAAREDLHEKNVSQCVPALIKGLQDGDGDVKSVSAEALTPITSYLVETESAADKLHQLVQVLCDSLQELDELTASTQSILTLLSKIVSSICSSKLSLYMNLQDTMSKLWIFTQHSTPSVRKAALLTLNTLLKSLHSHSKIPWFNVLAMNGIWSLAKCCITESNREIQLMVVEVWTKFCSKIPQLVLCEACQLYFTTLVSMAAQPDTAPFPKSMFAASTEQEVLKEGETEELLYYIGGMPSNKRNENDETRVEIVTRTRLQFARMLGILCGFATSTKEADIQSQNILQQTFHSITHHILTYVNSRFAIQRIVICMILSSWWETKESQPSPEIYNSLLNSLTEDLYFNEISSLFIQVQSEIKNIFMMTSKYFQQPLTFPIKPVYSLEDALTLSTELESKLQDSNFDDLKESHQRLFFTANEAQQEHYTLQRTVRSYVSHCLVVASFSSTSTTVNQSLSIVHLPKMNPIIRPLMEGLKREENQIHRNVISEALTYLLDICSNRNPCPNSKLIRNLCQFLKGDSGICPDLLNPTTGISSEILNQSPFSEDDSTNKIIITLLRNRVALIQSSENKRRKHFSPRHDKSSSSENEPNIARDGALVCMKSLCHHFNENIFETLPQLWTMICQPHVEENQMNGDVENGESEEKLRDKMLSLLIVEALAPVVNTDVAKMKVLSLLPQMFNLVWTSYSSVRYVCSRCLSVLAKRFPSEVMTKLVGEFLPSIDSSDLYKRMGIIELVSNIIDCLKTEILPYTVLLIVPLLGRMSDHNTQVRLIATQCFASLIQYLPVEASVPDAPDLPSVLVEKRKHERRFLEQLLDSSSLDQYPIPVPINAKLRSYQQDGVKWMAFLNRYKLHGVLCDDMGLGKTLQSICILASDHFYRAKTFHETNDSASAPIPSLVICPPTLTGHWVDEVERFCGKSHLDPLHYVGNPRERQRLQTKLSKHNLVIASYEVVRNDVEFFSKFDWNYCILDEGHMIRNGKSKLTLCIKSLRSNHRLILTGTPIQNSVLELWSLFDFLMPGFLGSEHEFNCRYGKPILASRDAKCSSKEQEEGVMAMEALHRQVLPFMLRRLKEDVLQDLPPKIIQDYYCNLSPLQVRLYEDFAKTKAKKEVDTSITHVSAEQTQGSRAKQTSHIFQALQYLQKVCNHPALVLTPCHPEYQQVINELAKDKSSLHDIQHSSKLMSLKQLLLDCGIGVPTDNSNNIDSVVGQHRALIFCQHKSMLDIVEHDLLRKHMKSVTFMRLDGSVVAANRHQIVSKFNNDPSIDLLLLTTKVGGLGLNLTGADTVIFIEHDWNPTVDLQAMDRAHRIGQKRVVNVYRLITRATLEEKILGLQQFKLNIANTVISTENSSLHSMGTNQVLDLFTIEKGAEKKKIREKDSSGKGLRTLMDDIGDLWDQNQYDTEYNLDNFMESLVS
ncbi:TATA-binding protein-associated factor 172-like isoform X2 [Styela clava]